MVCEEGRRHFQKDHRTMKESGKLKKSNHLAKKMFSVRSRKKEKEIQGADDVFCKKQGKGERNSRSSKNIHSLKIV